MNWNIKLNAISNEKSHELFNIIAIDNERMEVIPISRKEAYKVNVEGNNVSIEFWNQIWLITTSNLNLLYLCRLNTIMESPESRIVPTGDMDTLQLRISGERFPEFILELCDNCNWSLQCINHKGIVKTCPNCRSKVSLIPMNIDEICSLQHDARRGLTMMFDRRRPMR